MKKPMPGRASARMAHWAGDSAAEDPSRCHEAEEQSEERQARQVRYRDFRDAGDRKVDGGLVVDRYRVSGVGTYDRGDLTVESRGSLDDDLVCRVPARGDRAQAACRYAVGVLGSTRRSGHREATGEGEVYRGVGGVGGPVVDHRDHDGEGLAGRRHRRIYRQAY